MNSNASHPYKKLKDSELLNLTLLAAKTEKEATLALLDYLVEVDSRRLYATVNACSSLFEYLVKELGFSEPAASDRVNAVRLMRAVPEVKDHLETGKLNLTNAAQIQRFVNTEQKVNPKGKGLSALEKEKVVEACLGKSKREVEKTLFEKQSEEARVITQEKIRTLTPNRSEIKFTVDEDTLLKLKRIKDLVGEQSLEKIFDEALNALLLTEQKKRGVTDKKARDTTNHNVTEKNVTRHNVTENQKRVVEEEISTKNTNHDASFSRPAELEKTKTHAQLNSRFIPIDLKRLVFARSKGCCEFLDPLTHKRCQSTFRLQIDHSVPLALNGKTEASNLRHLCFAHNLRMASQAGLYPPKETVKERR